MIATAAIVGSFAFARATEAVPGGKGADRLACGPACAALVGAWCGDGPSEQALSRLAPEGYCSLASLADLLRESGLDVRACRVTRNDLQGWDGLAVLALGGGAGDSSVGHFVLASPNAELVFDPGFGVIVAAPPAWDRIESLWDGTALLVNRRAGRSDAIGMAACFGVVVIAAYTLSSRRTATSSQHNSNNSTIAAANRLKRTSVPGVRSNA